MKIDLVNLKEGRTDFFEREKKENLDLEGTEANLVDEVVAHYVLTRTGNQIKLEYELSFTLRLQCARCLEHFDVSFEDRDFFMIQTKEEPIIEEKELTLDDITTLFLPAQELDTTNIMRESILLHIPMKPLCNENCKGLCPVCGANLNVEDCGHMRKTTTSFGTQLKKVFEEFTKNEKKDSTK